MSTHPARPPSPGAGVSVTPACRSHAGLRQQRRPGGWSRNDALPDLHIADRVRACAVRGLRCHTSTESGCLRSRRPVQRRLPSSPGPVYGEPLPETGQSLSEDEWVAAVKGHATVRVSQRSARSTRELIELTSDAIDPFSGGRDRGARAAGGFTPLLLFGVDSTYSSIGAGVWATVAFFGVLCLGFRRMRRSESA
jgi:hypothetical protein